MVPRLVPEISSKCAFCDEAVGAAVGIGDSRSLIKSYINLNIVKKEEGDCYAWMCKLDWPSDHFGDQV